MEYGTVTKQPGGGAKPYIARYANGQTIDSFGTNAAAKAPIEAHAGRRLTWTKDKTMELNGVDKWVGSA